MPQIFEILPNEYLSKKTTGYYNHLYAYDKNNLYCYHILKNTFNNINIKSLTKARDEVCDILINDIPCILKDNGISNWIIMCVPRAKSYKKFSNNQLMFKEAADIAAKQISEAAACTDYIIRIKDTYTTHLDIPTKSGRIKDNTGPKPYPGITKNTCQIDNQVKDKNIILIDDIYTPNANIDEDCIQALYDCGAKNIIFYAIAYTNR